MTFFFISLFMLLVFWRPQDWLVPALYGWPILDVVFYLSLLTFLIEWDSRRVSLPRGYPQPLLLVGVFFAAIASHVAHTYYQGVINTVPDVFKICFFTIVLFCVVDRPSRLRTLARLFVVMACVMAVHAILQEKRGFGFAGSRPIFVGPIGDRPAHTRSLFFGIFEDPNDMAQILAASVPFAFAVFRGRGFLRFLTSCGIAALLVRAILTTHSRGGMVALTAVGGVLIALTLPKRWLPYALALLVVAGLVLCPVVAGRLDMSAYDRVIFWGLANRAFKANLFFGIGFGMFWQVASDRASHNAFVSCYTELGLFGYWFWFSLIVVGFMGAWRAMTRLDPEESDEHRWTRRMAGLTVAAMAGFCASAYFLSRAYVYPMFFLMALLGASSRVAQGLMSTEEEEAPPLVRTGVDFVGWGTVASVGSILYVYVSILLLNMAVG